MKFCDECGGKHYAKGKCQLHYKMPSQLNPKPIKSNLQRVTPTRLEAYEQQREIMNKALEKALKPKPIAKFSEKEKKRQAAYIVLKKEYMKHYPNCQVNLEGCNHISVDIHHLYFGADRYSHFLDSTSWKSTCRFCHDKIHNSMSNDELINLGLRLKD